MDIPYLINILQNKFNYLNNARSAAVAVGDVGSVTSIEQEILTTQNTIAQLQFLQSVNQVALDNNTSTSEVIANGLSAIQNTQIIPDGPTEILAFYDITSYATDPLHEQKIADILSFMGVMNTATEIDIYINNETIGSPITGQMILDAATRYDVDTRLMMAIMEQDSNFGTAGVAVSTLNPGNVGNTGEETRTYSSWQDGVNAVAEWLSRHRITKTEQEVITEIKNQEEPVKEVIQEPTYNTENTENIENIENIDNATTTPEVIIEPEATTTPEIINENSTSTPEVIIPDYSATTTPEILNENAPVILEQATSTPEMSTSTQAHRRMKKITVVHVK